MFLHFRQSIRNSSIKYDLENVIIKDIIPNGFTVKDLQPAQFCRIKLKELTCNLNNVSSRSSGKIIIKIHKNDQWQKELDNPKKTKPLVTFSSKNVLTSFEFNTENFKSFSASEFFEVLKVSFYYTIFGTAGALLVGLLAAQILQKSLGKINCTWFTSFPLCLTSNSSSFCVGNII